MNQNSIIYLCIIILLFIIFFLLFNNKNTNKNKIKQKIIEEDKNINIKNIKQMNLPKQQSIIKEEKSILN